MKIVILSRKSHLYSTKRLVQAGEKRKHEMLVVDHTKCDLIIEKKRPYNRFTLIKDKISMNIDLNDLLSDDTSEDDQYKRIREKQNSGVRFTTSRDGQQISSVSIWIGDGRDRKERKINFSNAQGKFMFHLPFPTANYKSIGEIMKQSGIDSEHHSEINDIVEEMIRLNVIEEKK